jgi:hypothetical protein
MLIRFIQKELRQKQKESEYPN